MSPVSCYRPDMSTPDTNVADVPLAVRVDRNITAELARKGMRPAADLPEITGLSEDSVARRRKAGDWRLDELVAIAKSVGVGVSTLVGDVPPAT